eukprot:gnl/TRDRNA2_/TRDRNA2_173019_c0_seq2.p1 gnl/TRDRNA2_/TRDRNA2_173019_c0~~gnl/TRDRNA2_/TRDRNA2_173019_c0_seq2.p1  ORF type:complete len:253 (+),score=41.13 gnl/TRDRNA2_/TRDRNA2_173019_c0_seq2:2-760(+)
MSKGAEQKINSRCLAAGAEHGFQVAHVTPAASDDRPGERHIWNPAKSSPHMKVGAKLAGGPRQEIDNKVLVDGVWKNAKWQQDVVSKVEKQFQFRMECKEHTAFEKILTGEKSEPAVSLRNVRTIEVPVGSLCDRTVLGGPMHAAEAQKTFKGVGRLGHANMGQFCGFTVLAIVPPKESERKVILFPGATDIIYAGDTLLFPLVMADEKKYEDLNHVVTDHLNELENYELFTRRGGMPRVNPGSGDVGAPGR